MTTDTATTTVPNSGDNTIYVLNDEALRLRTKEDSEYKEAVHNLLDRYLEYYEECLITEAEERKDSWTPLQKVVYDASSIVVEEGKAIEGTHWPQEVYLKRRFLITDIRYLPHEVSKWIIEEVGG